MPHVCQPILNRSPRLIVLPPPHFKSVLWEFCIDQPPLPTYPPSLVSFFLSPWSPVAAAHMLLDVWPCLNGGQPTSDCPLREKWLFPFGQLSISSSSTAPGGTSCPSPQVILFKLHHSPASGCLIVTVFETSGTQARKPGELGWCVSQSSPRMPCTQPSIKLLASYS